RLEQGIMCSLGQWNTPPGYNPKDRPEGHICYDTITRRSDEVLVVHNLPETVYARTDPNVKAYNLKTYVGRAVRFGDDYVGSLCAVFQDDFYPDEEDKKLMSFVASAIAVEEKRMQSEKSFMGSEKRFRSIVESANDAIILADSRGKMILWNKGARLVFGYTEEEMISMPADRIIPERYRDHHQKMLNLVLSTGKSDFFGRTVESIGRRKDGSEFPIEISITTWNIEKEAYYSVIIRDITERKRTEEQIIASLKEKEVLLREIHHRVKNNMQIISSLLRLQSENIRDEKYLGVFKDSYNRIKTMSLVHEKLYQSKDFANINLREYINDLVVSIFQSFFIDETTISLTMDIEDVPIKIDMAIPCGLVINELVTNSLKYAFKDGKKGEIRVILHRIGTDRFQLVVGDNGVSIPEDLDFRRTETLGLRLVTMLVEDQLLGEINLDRRKGTEFTITFRG
ncbi:MAG TPA: PAS domain S-box protein, partial [Candidatus Methanoperedens sp.]